MLALGDQFDRARDHVAVDLLQHAVLFGDLDEGGGRDQFAVAAVQAQEGVVHRMVVALQVDDRLEVQDEALVVERVAQAFHPGLDALGFGAVHGVGIEQFEAVAADAGRRLHAGGRLGEDLADAGVLLADLHAADAGGDHARALTDGEHLGGEGIADARRQGLGRGVVAVAHQHGEGVLGEARGDRGVADLAAQAFGDGGHDGVGRVQADLVEQALVVVRLDHQQAVLRAVLRGIGHRILQRMQEGRAVEQAGGLVELAQLLDLARKLRVHRGFLAAEDHLLAGFAFVLGQREFHDGGEGVAFDVARFQLVARRRRLALAHALEQLL